MKDIFSIKLGELLTQTRINKGMSQQEVADRLGVSDVTISRYEKGQREIAMPTYIKICDIYNVDAYELLEKVRKYIYRRWWKIERQVKERNTVANWEQQRREVGADELLKIYDIFGVDTNEYINKLKKFLYK